MVTSSYKGARKLLSLEGKACMHSAEAQWVAFYQKGEENGSWGTARPYRMLILYGSAWHGVDAQKLLACVIYLWFHGNFLTFRTDRRITEARFRAMKMFQKFF